MSIIDIGSFNLMTSLNHIRKNGNLEKQWQYKKKNAITEDMSELQKKNAQYKSIFDQLNEQKGDQTLQRIMSKFQAGKKLSSSEMQYLQKTNPMLYQQVLNAEREAAAYEEELRRCETKDEVRRIKMNKINASIAKIQSAERSGLPEGARLAIAQAELAKMQQIEQITLKFIESGEFQKLPTDAEKMEAEQAIKEAEREALQGEEIQEAEVQEAESRKQEAEFEGAEAQNVEISKQEAKAREIESSKKVEVFANDARNKLQELENSPEFKKIKGTKVKSAYVKAQIDFNPQIEVK